MRAPANPLEFWFRAGRTPFLTAPLLSVVLAAAFHRFMGGTIAWGPWWLTLVGVGFVNLGINLVNDYYDHRQGSDNLNQHRTMFNGGSGFIQAGWATARQIRGAGWLCLGVAALIGLHLVSRTGPVLWWVIAAGSVLSVGYSAPPLSLGSTGWGELVAGLSCGPLVALGAYWVLGGSEPALMVLVAIPLGLLVSAILVINEIPDEPADAQVGKRTLVVRWGSAAGIRLHRVLIGGAYASVMLLVLLRLLPLGSLAVLLTLPVALKTLRHASGGVSSGPVEAFTGAMAGTVGLHVLVSVVVAASILW